MNTATRPQARLEARLSSDALSLLKRAAEIEGRSLTDFVVSAASAAAHATIERTHIIRLSEESSRFVAAMLADEDARPTSAMMEVMELHKKLIDPL